MCGLIALLDRSTSLDAPALEAGLATLRARGPDGSGTWWGEARDVALAHARLAIVDVDGGAQPLSSEDGAVVAMLNGELYGAQELRAALRASGHRFRSGCDAELLVHLYEDCGPAMVQRLRGEFAFVLYDRRRRRLMGARDPDGVRPLYLAQRGSRVMLASTVRALMAAGAQARWDMHALSLSAALQYPPPGATLFDGVSCVPAGGMVFADATGVRVEAAASVRSSQAEDLESYPGSDPEASLRAALDDAVRARLPAEVSFACALSGGLDSSAVLALATRLTGTAPPAFTVRFEGDVQCEWALAAETARALGSAHHEVRLDDAALADALPTAVRDGEGNAINAHLVGKWALARAVAAEGHKVLLNGEGADEVAFGYAHFLADAGLAPTESQRAMLEGGMLASQRPAADQLAPGAPHFVHAKLALGERIHSLGQFGSFEQNAGDALLALEQAVEQGVGAPRWRAARGPDAVDARLERSRAWWRASAFERYILGTLGDAVELAHGVEGRPPFLDGGVQRACARIAPSEFMRGGVEKQALRRALDGVLPASTLARRKQPFFASPMLLSERPGCLLALARATLTGPTAPAFVNGHAVAQKLDRLRGASLAERREWEAPLMWMLTSALLEQELLR